ncbi:low molecular weight protein arginine phosphatase [Macrococcus lamae]|uniref:Low molecular weight protein-tyrosine-phosphatase PtpB n=1 Tax=Macrococcus lamae TaxID=198484 RepID=A0A4R6BU70_9STAP|nr:low molecular weight protein arginine phosphatase [Macrococcus lamae]TDM10576.1 low molecular weight protein arginine phosphatase [Macrococcus lamae]
MKVIFVCTGNTCRSPLAESIAKSLTENHEFTSRGLSAYSGAPVSQHSAALIRQHQLPEPSTAEQFTDEDATADLIVTMSSSHKQYIEVMYPGANVYRLSEYAAGDMQDINDPYGGNMTAYERAYEQIEMYVRQLIETLDNTK